MEQNALARWLKGILICVGPSWEHKPKIVFEQNKETLEAVVPEYL